MSLMIRKIVVLIVFSILCWDSRAQTQSFGHSHNDYENKIPFYEAFFAGMRSIEADVYFWKDSLLVAHEPKDIRIDRSLRALYLEPLKSIITKDGNELKKMGPKGFQLMIDIKTAAVPSLNALIQQLQQYPEIINSEYIRISISGNRPSPDTYTTYPDFIWFDGEIQKTYSPEALTRIVMMSDNFGTYAAKWNGKGRVSAEEEKKIVAAVTKVHQLGKKIRFWNSPDNINAWYHFSDWGVDYINTDHSTKLCEFLKTYPIRSYTNATQSKIYQPKYKNDGASKPVKNVILLIGDGTSLAHWFAGYTANHAFLNVFNMRSIGLSKTSSADNFVTDSAPGSTAFASGQKTKNRYVGADTNGLPLLLLPAIFEKRGMKTALITSGDITDATPADFYAHQSERSKSDAILRDLLKASIAFIAGGYPSNIPTSLQDSVKVKFDVVANLSDAKKGLKPVLVSDSNAYKSILQGRGAWLTAAFEKAVSIVQGPKGFFMMLEGAQVDHGAHANDLPKVATEVIDFDQAVAAAMKFADNNGETLVIVTADHETGGLTLLDGDYKKGFIAGQFASDDHSAIPVPVFAYGPGSQYFRGVYENTEIFRFVLKAMRINN